MMLNLLSWIAQAVFLLVAACFALYAALELFVLLISRKVERRKLTEIAQPSVGHQASIAGQIEFRAIFYNMERNSRHQVIKRLQTGLSRGAPFDLATLERFGVSPQLAAYYAGKGWLVRLAQGIYAFPNDDFGVHGALMFLQKRAPGLHVGGKSALAWQGVRHNVGGRDVLVLWGERRFARPVWFTSRFPARHVHACLFDWPDISLAGQTVNTPPGLPDGLSVAVPERAVLELLYEAGVKQSLEEARNIFAGLRPPRGNLLGQLLSCCTSVKAVRLFLAWARETGLVDVDALLEQYPVRTGSPRRWMSRLDDGFLLSLKPHG
jgi:hypothetical protein